MRHILAQLNKTQGIWGSMVAGRDGLTIAADFSNEVPEAQMGAIASQMLMALDGALKRIKLGAFKRFLIGGSENKLALIAVNQVILIVMMRRDANMGLINVEIKTAAEAVAKNTKM